MTSMRTVGATASPLLYVHPGIASYNTTASSWPAFSGVWTIDRSTLSVTGTFADFEQFSTSINLGLFGSAVVNQPHLVYLFNLGTVVYTPDPTLATGGTLTVGDAMTCPGSDSVAQNSQTSSGALQFDSSNGASSTCAGSATICNAHNIHFLGRPDLERFYLTLTLSADFSHFSGTAVGADIGGAMPLGTTGNTWYCYSFTGS